MSFCSVVSHPFFAVTGKDGKFNIGDIPPGEYEIEAVHEKAGSRPAKVTIVEGKPATVDFRFSKPAKKKKK